MLHARLRAAAGGTWTPANLFANGESGGWYEPYPQYLYQDSAATVAVSSEGDPVGYKQDLSGNAANFTQSSTSRPTYSGLSYDGTDDFMVAGGLSAPGTSPFFICAALSPYDIGSFSGFKAIFSFGQTGSGQLLFYYADGDLRIYLNSGTVDLRQGPYTSGQSYVVSVGYDGSKYFIRSGGVEVISETRAATNLSTSYAGRIAASSNDNSSADRFLDADIGPFVYRVGSYAISDLEKTESYVANLFGVTLP